MEALQVRMVFFYFSVLGLVAFPSSSYCETVLVDGVTEWKNPTVNIGDSIIFRHKYHYSVYIFRSRLAFNLCDFTQATRLTSPNSSSYTWHPSRLGNFYFSFKNGTDKPCQQGQKLAIKVIPQNSPTNTILPPATAPAPLIVADPPLTPPVKVATPPSPGGVVSSSPAYPWPFQPREKSAGPGSSPAPISVVPDGKGGSVPFINSNPAVPLPTGEVDSATIRPLPTSANNHALPQVQVVGLLGLLIPQCIAVLLML